MWHPEMRLILTRPRSKMAQAMADYQAKGWSCIEAPCIDTITTPGLKPEWLASAEQAPCLVVLSSHAIHHARQIKPDFRVSHPERVIAVGPAVQQAWQQTFGQTIIDAGGDSEAVIALLEQRDVRRLTVLTAAGGRELIKSHALKHRIDYHQINCYQRIRLALDVQQWQQALHQGDVILTATSGQIIHHIKQQLPDDLWQSLLSQAVVVPSKRVASVAAQTGFTDVVLAEAASNQAMIHAIENRWGRRAAT